MNMMSMKNIITIILAIVAVSTASSKTYNIERGNNLQSIINYAASGDTLILDEITYRTVLTPFDDSLCGNCQNPDTVIKASYGFVIRNKSLVIVGLSRSRTILVTKAGYGLYIENCPDIEIKNLTITGGVRDLDGMATDAGIVVRNSRVRVIDVDIRDNDHQLDSVVVGIGGIFGREGADIEIRNCNIDNNGWDGIALYRGATAVAVNNKIKNGRGVGIGVTWDASCLAYNNEITGYWKGIGAFGSSWVIARNNLIHENLGWGMVATGKSYMDITNNVIFHNGNCGIAPWSTDSRGRIVNNIVVENGWREYWVCACVGVRNNGDWAKWEFKNNIVYNNKDGEYENIWDQTGLNGNLSVDPMFIGGGDFLLQEGSPGLYGGDSLIYNTDGTVSHIGLYGGPQAWSK